MSPLSPTETTYITRDLTVRVMTSRVSRNSDSPGIKKRNQLQTEFF